VTRILIVDDDQSCRESLRLLLSLENFDVAVAADGQEALALVKEYVPDVLLVDWKLSGPIDGLQVAEALRAIHPKVQVVVITGYPSAELEARVKSLPAFQYLRKPFSTSELLAGVHKAVGGVPRALG
jgi:DNA-binding response OmpR family regulator